jgi:hypothetical protein
LHHRHCESCRPRSRKGMLKHKHTPSLYLAL